MTINEIHKIKFIESQSENDFLKLYEYAHRNPGFFDDEFLISSFKNAHVNKNIKGITYVVQLYIVLDRLIEADYVLNVAFKDFPDDVNLLYFLSDVSSRRHCFFQSHHFAEKLRKLEGKLLYTKAQIKFLLIKGESDLIIDFISMNFETYQNDIEFISLIYEAARITSNSFFAYKTFSSSHGKLIANNLNKRNSNIAKNLVVKYLVEILLKIANGL